MESATLGVELVTDGETLTLADRVVEGMKARGIQLNTKGYDNNIIKIKPPLINGEEDVDRLVSSLDNVLAELL